MFSDDRDEGATGHPLKAANEDAKRPNSYRAGVVIVPGFDLINVEHRCRAYNTNLSRGAARPKLSE